MANNSTLNPMIQFNVYNDGAADTITSFTFDNPGAVDYGTGKVTSVRIYRGSLTSPTATYGPFTGSGSSITCSQAVSIGDGETINFWLLYDIGGLATNLGDDTGAGNTVVALTTGGTISALGTFSKTVEGIDVNTVLGPTDPNPERGDNATMLRIPLDVYGETMNDVTLNITDSTGHLSTTYLDSVNVYDGDPDSGGTLLYSTSTFSSPSTISLVVDSLAYSASPTSYTLYVTYKIKSTAPSSDFTLGAKLNSVTATSEVGNDVTATGTPSSAFTVSVGNALAGFSVSNADSTPVNTATNVTITAVTSTGATLTTYTGSVTVSTDSADPSGITWTKGTSTYTGAATFSFASSDAGQVILTIKDSHPEDLVITVEDTSTPPITGSSTLEVSPPLANFGLTAANTAPPLGTETAIIVTARDSSNVPITSYEQAITLKAMKVSGSDISSPASFHFRGGGITDNNNGTATVASTAWSFGTITVYVSYTVGAEAVKVKAYDASTTPMIGYSPDITWQGGPAGGSIILTPNPKTIPPNGTDTSIITSDILHDANGFPIPDGTQFTVATTLGTITDADRNPAISGIQIESSAGGITIHLLAPTTLAPTTTTGSAVVTAEAVSGSPKGNTRVFISNLKVVSVSSPDTIVNRLDTGKTVQITIRNIGSVATLLADLKPAFYSGLISGSNVSGEYSAVPGFSTPANLLPAETRTFNFSVAAPNLRTNGEIILDAMMEVTGDPYIYKRWKEQNIANWHAIAETTDSWTATGGITYTVDAPAYVSYMTTTNSTGATRFNNGDALLPSSSLNIYFFDGGYNIDLTSGPLVITRGGTTLTSGSDYQYYPAEGRLTIRDMGTASGALVLTNVKDLSGMVLNASGGDQIRYVISTGLFIGQFLCYPNPATAGSSVKFGWEQTKDATVRIYLHNSTGELLWQKEVSARSGYNEVTWEGSDSFGRVLGGGIYALRLLATDSDGNTYLTRTKLGIF